MEGREGLALSRDAGQRMNLERWESAKRLFHDALERPPADRDRFVRAEAIDDAALCEEVLALLSAQTRADAAFGDIARSHAVRAFLPGRRLGPYEIHHLIGAGGMGEVYQARDTKLGRDVAIKVLGDAMTSDPQSLVRFTREAHAVAALNHPHIVTIFSTEEANGIPFMTMELVEGRTLDQL